MSATTTKPPAVRRYTPDDLLRMADGGKGYELVDGELKELNVSYQSSFLAGRVFLHMANFTDANNLGWVTPEGTSYRCFPDDPTRVRRADTAFHRLDRLTREQATSEGHCTVVPDLVVEVVSPNDLADFVNDKRLEWLEAGAALVWVIYPPAREVHAFWADGSNRVYRLHDELDAEPVIPGFRVPVADLFRMPTLAK